METVLTVEDVVTKLTKCGFPYPMDVVVQAMSMKEELTPIMLEALRQSASNKTLDGREIDEEYSLSTFALRLLGYWRVPETALILLDLVATKTDDQLYEEWDDSLYTDFEAVIAETLTDETIGLLVPTMKKAMRHSPEGLPVIPDVFYHLKDTNTVTESVWKQIVTDELIPMAKDPTTHLDYRIWLCEVFMHLQWPETKELCLEIAEKVVPESSCGADFDREDVERAFKGEYFITFGYERYNSENALLNEMPRWIAFAENRDEEDDWVHSSDEWDDEKDNWSAEDELRMQQKIWEMQNVRTPITVLVKIGRNDLCTCGSGKKYKKCCGKG